MPQFIVENPKSKFNIPNSHWGVGSWKASESELQVTKMITEVALLLIPIRYTRYNATFATKNTKEHRGPIGQNKI